MNKKLTLQELELLDTATAYNGEQHRAICGRATLELIEYKKIEDELGIDLITLSEALKNGIWIKKTFIEPGDSEVIITKNLFFFYENVSLYEDCLYACPIDIYDEKVYINQYGRTWALTKEELL